MRMLIVAAAALVSSSALAANADGFEQALKASSLSLEAAVLNQAADLQAGEVVYNRSCVACHGAPMLKAVRNYPSLHGQKPMYVFKQLLQFKAGERNSPIMQGQAMTLSQTDMKNVSFYLSRQPTQDLR